MNKFKCPDCGSNQIVKNGRDFRSSDSRYVQRLLCKECGKYFSNATFSAAKHQNKRRLNNNIYRLLVRGMSISDIASYLYTTKTTVLRKLKFIAEQKEIELQKLLSTKKGKVNLIVIDELLTHVHTKCKPVSVAMAVEKGTGFMLSTSVSQSPATGKLAAISKRKYGPRPNEEKKGLESLFDDVIPLLGSNVLVESDRKTMYKSVVQDKLNSAKIRFTHLRYKGVKDKERGQGEMMNHAIEFDPLFYINHAFAKLRYRISRLARKTWCNTKKQENLEAHLKILMCYNNEMMHKISNKYRQRLQ